MATQQPTNKVWGIELVGWRAPRSGRFGTATREAQGDMEDLVRQVGAKIIVPALKRESPVGHYPLGRPAGLPRFADSWDVTYGHTSTGGSATVSNRAPHAGFVLLPTKPHPIRPGRGKYLRFMSKGGSLVFSRGVTHPGTKGNDVIGRVQDRTAGDVKNELQKAAKKVSQRVADIFQ